MRERRNPAARQPAGAYASARDAATDAAATANRTSAPGSVVTMPLAVALIAVGLIGLTLHYWIPLILLAALPTREWRKAALTSDLASLALKPPARLRRDPRRPDLLRGRAG